MKHRKPEAQRKADTVRMRVTAEQRKILAAAAERDGLELSSWIRAIALRTATATAPPTRKAAKAPA
jgi:uncharacterized protein (DUF1778 family)